MAQEVLVVFPRLVEAELLRLFAKMQRGSKRPASEATADAGFVRALESAAKALDEHLFLFSGPNGERFGLEAGGSLLALLHHSGVVYSICVGDCEGAAFFKSGVEQRLSNWPHNCNNTKVGFSRFELSLTRLRQTGNGARSKGFWLGKQRMLFF